MLKKVILFFSLLIGINGFFSPVPAQAVSIQPEKQEKGIIIAEKSKNLDETGHEESISYSVKLDSGKTVTAIYQLQTLQKLDIHPGSHVVLAETQTPKGYEYHIIDMYRLPSFFYFLIVFAIIVIAIVGKKGIGSLLGLCISLLIILFGIVPGILKGFSPLLVTTTGAFAILFITTFLAHGVSKKTTIAVVATAISLLLTLMFGYICIHWLFLTGTGNENIADIYFATNKIVNAQGLLLSGIVIGTLGALNDVTVTQSSTIFELHKLDKSADFWKLFQRGMVIGRDHGASMVNTIILAYAGSSLFLFIFLIINPQKQPIWGILNNEFMVEEILIALGGTLGILMSVPIVTLLASYGVTSQRFSSHVVK